MSMKSERKSIVKAGAKRLLGHASGWQAHKVRQCLSTCHYCKARQS